jgi:O-antigen/teichoic acid export membrane protein
MGLYSRKSARKSLIDTVTFRALSQIATALGYIVMVRAMSREDFGVLNLLYAFYPLVSTVASLGLEQTLRRYQPDFLSGGRPEAAHWLWRTVARARFAVNIAVLLLVLLTWNLTAPLFKLTPYRVEFALFCIPMLLLFQVRILRLSLASHMLQRHSLGALAWLAIVKLVAYVLITAFGTLTLDMAILTDTLGYAAAYAMLVRAHRRYCTPAASAAPFVPTATDRRRLLRYAAYNNFSDAGSYVINVKSDNLFIAAILDTVSVGVYSFYTRLNQMVIRLLPTRLFDNVLQPLFYAVPPGEAATRLPRYFSLLLNMNLLLQWPAFAFVCVYHRELVHSVFGDKFVDQSWLLPLIVGFTLLDIVANPVTIVAQYQEKAATLLLSKAFGVYNVVALLVMLPLLGVAGAAIASGSTQILRDAFIWWRVRGTARWLNARAALAYGLLVWTTAIFACITLKKAIHIPDVAHLIVGATVIAGAWLIYVRTPAIAECDRLLLASVMRGKERRILRLIGLIGERNGSRLVAD